MWSLPNTCWENSIWHRSRHLDIAPVLAATQGVHSRRVTYSEDQCIYHVKVVKMFLHTMNKLVHFRPLLEENTLLLSHRKQMDNIVSLIFQQEQDLVKQQIWGKCISVVFDDTSKVYEAMTIVVHYAHSEADSLTPHGKEHDWRRDSSCLHWYPFSMLFPLITSWHACKVGPLVTIFRYILDTHVGCVLHTLGHVGDKICAPNHFNFMVCWLSLFSYSSKPRFFGKKQTDWPIHTYCPTKWGSKWECMDNVWINFWSCSVMLSHFFITDVLHE